MTFRRRFVSAGLVLAAILAGVAMGCGGKQEEAAARAPRITVAPVAGRDFEERIEASGELVAVNHAEIAAEVEGRVTELLVEEGTAVEEGAPLLRIDPERRELELADVKAQVAELTSALREAEREHERIRKLESRGAASTSALDSATTARQAADSRLRAAQARLGVAERALRDATVRAAFAGSVARRSVSVGEYVRPGQPLVELVALDPIEVEFHLPEVDSSRAQLDQPVTISVAPYPGEHFVGRVTMVSPTIDPLSRTLRVKAQIENSDGRLRPGLFARADLGIAQRSGVPMVAEEAVLQRAEGPVVFVLVEGSRVQRRVIQTGRHREGEVEVVAGLSPGDRVATRGHTSLLDGIVVEVQDAGGHPEGAPMAVRDPRREEALP